MNEKSGKEFNGKFIINCNNCIKEKKTEVFFSELSCKKKTPLGVLFMYKNYTWCYCLNLRAFSICVK